MIIEWIVAVLLLLLVMEAFIIQWYLCKGTSKLTVKLIPVYLIAFGYLLCLLMCALGGGFGLRLLAGLLAVFLCVPSAGILIAWIIYGIQNACKRSRG